MNENLIEALQSVCRATGAPPEITKRIVAAAKGTEATAKDKAVTTRAAAGVLECSTKTVYRLAARGLLNPIRRSSRCVRWRLSEVERLALRGVE